VRVDRDEAPRYPRGLTFLDAETGEVVLDDTAARALMTLTANLEAATVSACPECRSRVLAAVALVDLLDASPPHDQGPDLVQLADEAPTLHVYVVDGSTQCTHDRWLDPGFAEWAETVLLG
jgi:hypothetical protein